MYFNFPETVQSSSKRWSVSLELGRSLLQVEEVFGFKMKFYFENILRHLLCKVAQLKIHSASFTQFSEKSKFRDFDTLMPRRVLFGEFQAFQNIPPPHCQGWKEPQKGWGLIASLEHIMLFGGNLAQLFRHITWAPVPSFPQIPLLEKSTLKG